MCFHNSLSVESQKLENRYEATFQTGSEFKLIFHASAFQFPKWPVITCKKKKQFQLFTWGLIPNHTKTIRDAEQIRTMTLNARFESLREKKSFSGSFARKRCLIPSTGFFEWQHAGKQKIPWFVYPANEEIFSMAGLFDEWIQPETKTIIQTFSIVTTEASGIMVKIHNTKQRMPLILTRDTEHLWLENSFSDIRVEETRALLSTSLKGHTVSPLINHKGNKSNIPDVTKKQFYNVDGALF
jgi:putative SOS response-associated peptidase YedK